MDDSGYLSAGNIAVSRELLSKPLIIDNVVEILDVQVNSLVPIHPLQLQSLKAVTKLRLALCFLLRSSHIQLSASSLSNVYNHYQPPTDQWQQQTAKVHI